MGIAVRKIFLDGERTMDKKLINEANKIVEFEMLKEAVKEMAEYVPVIAKMTMDVYKGFLAEGFNEQQAFNFAKEFVLKSIFK